MYRKEITTYIKKLDIPEDKIAEYKEAFDMFDKDGSGTIDVGEIVKIMKNFGYPIKKSEAQRMISEIDDNGDGELDFEEFVTLMEKQTNYVDQTEEELVLTAFKSFDKDHDGKITNHEFKYLLTQMGDKFTDEELNLLFQESDLDINGTLDYQDFINFWKKYN
jgi:calmodulin